MAKSSNVDRKNGKREYRYGRVTITYSDNEISGRVFEDHNKAEADPKKIALNFEGIHNVAIDSGGNLTMESAAGKLTLVKPSIYQINEGEKRPVRGAYVFVQTIP